MNINFEEILKELEYRVEHGIIDLNKEEQVTTLVEILRESGVSDANEMAQKARVYYSYINEATKKQSLDKVLAQKFINPDTDREVTVASALGYEKKSQAYIKAKGMMKTAGYSEKDIDMVPAGPDDEEKPKGKKLSGGDYELDIEKDKKQEPTQSDDKEKAANVANDLYSGGKKGNVIGDVNEGDNKVKNDMLKNGFKGYQKATGKKPAPGSEGSAFNEIISGEGVKVLEKSPDLSELELTRVLVSQFCSTKLGKEQSLSADVARDLPKDLKTNKCASKALIAARSAKKKFGRANQTKEDLQSKGLLSQNTKIHAFYGAEDSKTAQIDMVKNAKRVMMPDGTVVDKDDAIALVAAGGGGANPSDTAIFMQDDEGNVVIKFYSDKTSTADIQDNSTLAQEINDRLGKIDEYEKNKILSPQQAKKARAIISNHAKNISKVENSYSDGNTFVAQNLSKNQKGYGDKEQFDLLNSGRDKTLLANLDIAVKDSKGYKKEIIENLPKGCNPEKPSQSCLYISLRNVVAKGPEFTEEEAIVRLKAAGVKDITQKKIDKARNMPSQAQQKVIMKISGMLTSDYINAGKEVPDGIDVNSIVSVQRKKVVESYHKMNRELDEITVKVGNVRKGLGTLSQAEDTIDSFHLGLMDYPPKKYKKGDMHSMIGQCFEVSMGGPMVNGQLLRECMGVNNTQEFKERFTVKETQELTYEFSEKQALEKLKTAGINPTKKAIANARNVTGMKIFSYAIDKKTKEQQEIGFRTYRGKAGKTSKTSTTMQYSDGIRKCFVEKSKKK